jgi:drug/metabolite transporter (DMT)-like permease
VAPWLFVLIWSTGFIVARYGMPHAAVFDFLALRFGLSMLVFALWVRFSDAELPRDRRQWLHLAVCGVLIHAGYLGGVWAAVKAGMSAGTAALICGLQPVLTALWVQFSQGGRVSAGQWAGLGLGFAGLLLVVWNKLAFGEASTGTLLLACMALAAITAGTLYQKRYVRSSDARSATFIQLIAATAVTAPLAAMQQEPMHWHPELWGAMAWSVLVLTLGGSSLLFWLVQRGAATQVTSLLYLVPPCTALQGWLLFNEGMGPLVWVGMGLSAWGVWWVLRPQPPGSV